MTPATTGEQVAGGGGGGGGALLLLPRAAVGTRWRTDLCHHTVLRAAPALACLSHLARKAKAPAAPRGSMALALATAEG